MTSFGEFIKNKRLYKGKTLREFCRECCIDPSNWSKIERGIADPPKSLEIINRIVQYLLLSPNEAEELIILATVYSIPLDLRPEEYQLSKLPIFFRTLRGDKAALEDMEKLIEKLKQA